MLQRGEELNQQAATQEYVAEAAGRDLRVIVVGNRPVAAMERRAPDGDFRANLHQGGTAVPVTLDPATRRVECHGTEVELSAKEYALLHALMQQPGRALSRAQLEQHLYAWGDEIGSNAVEVYIHHLRRKLGPDVIRTLRGIGYVVAKAGGKP